MSVSPIRCRSAWKMHRRPSEPDRWLDEMGFFRKHMARDPSCLFRAVSENVYNTQRYFHRVRLECVNFMTNNCHLFEGLLSCSFENYLNEMTNPSEWGGLTEISAMSHLYRRDFVIFEANKGPQTKICNGYGNTIYLYYFSDSKHFDVVYTKEFINMSSFCQSLVYEVLYDGVFQLKDLPYAVEKMLHDKVSAHHIEYFMAENVERRKKQKETKAKIFIEATNANDKDGNSNALALKCKHHTQDVERASLLKDSLSIFVINRSLIQLENVCVNCLNVNSAKDLFDNGITPFPYKVAKALDPDIYRNIEFDAWSELRREMRYGALYSDGTTLQVGVKCLCKLQPDQAVPYHCHIQEMHKDGGPCLVFIEELGEKRVVNYEQLEPLPSDQIRPWAPPYRYSRANSQLLTLSQMLQQIGNISRKQTLKPRHKSKNCIDTTKSLEKSIQNIQIKQPMLMWDDKNEEDVVQPNVDQNQYFYDQLGLYCFESVPVEAAAMVDCRPHEMNGSDAHHNHMPQSGGAGGAGDMNGPPMNTTIVRASTPAANAALVTYTGAGMSMPVGGTSMAGGGAGSVYSCGGYVCGVKPLMWCAPPPPHVHPPPPHPPPPVNPCVYKSVQPNGADLPMNDIPTLRYYFNLGVECMWASYGPPPPAPPPRHYSPRDLAQEMAAVSLNERGENKHNKPNEKPPQNKGNGQRPLLGPRFKRGNNQEGGGHQNNNHAQNKPHNNNMNNNRPHNHRRNSQMDGRNQSGGYMGGAPGGNEDCPEGSVLLPYMPYPPPAPLYPMPYYPIDSEAAMMGMMGGMGYVPGYEEGVEFAPPLQYYAPPPPQAVHYPPPPPPPASHAAHQEHK